MDLAAARDVVGLVRDLASGASRPEVYSGVGGFAGLFDLGDGRLLAAAADGVGTKLELARLVGRLDTIGIDLVAMSANDVVCTGAEPVFFLDYVSVSRLIPQEVAAIVSGVAEGCRRAGCALLGGETAEHQVDDGTGPLDLAGFCVGIVERARLLDPGRVRPGDVLIGVPSTGLHANGFTLVRRALVRAGRSLEEFVPALGRTLAEELLEPTAVYVRPVLAAARAGVIRSAAHITGGGWQENVPRALPDGLAALVDTDAWMPPPIVPLMAEATGLSPGDMFGVFNMGIGMVLVAGTGEAEEATAVLRTEGADAVVVGRVAEGRSTRLLGRLAPGG